MNNSFHNLQQNHPPLQQTLQLHKKQIKFYNIIMKYMNIMPRQQTQIYMKKMLLASITQLSMQITFWGYFLYCIVCRNKNWFIMTTSPMLGFFRMVGLAYAPDIFVRFYATRCNHMFYNRNRYFLQSNLTKQEINRLSFNQF